MDITLYVIQDQKNQKYFWGYVDNGYFHNERLFTDLNDKDVIKFKSRESAQEVCNKLQKEHDESYKRLLSKDTLLDRKYEVKEIKRKVDSCSWGISNSSQRYNIPKDDHDQEN